ncbi:MAG TPA: lipoyl(octanoyl) transferase LipB [Dehalococcoidia bacterium]|nr:lipoyl(octanoyl) transferase LipB [Dehalococcoidia bacterium]
MDGAAICEYAWLGRIDYVEAWELQKRLAHERASGSRPDTLLLLEHHPVYTTGKRDANSNLRLPEGMLGAPLVQTDRGGDITFHGPGQLIAYPIIELREAKLGVVDYVRRLEEAIIGTLRTLGIEAGVICGLTGVWVGDAKIAAIGIRVGRPPGTSGWVTTHGLALNVDVDLEWFQRIVPCGIADKGVTSIRELLGVTPPIDEVSALLGDNFGRVFGREMRPVNTLLTRPQAPVR